MSADNPRIAELVQHCLPELPQGRGRILLPGDRRNTLATGSDRHNERVPDGKETLTMEAQKLTIKQEQFCLTYMETGSGAEAYRTAYSAENMKPATIHRRAFDLLENGKVQARLAKLRQPAIEAAGLTLQAHLEELARLRDQAKQEGKLTAAITAEISRGRAAGLYRQADGPGTAVQVNIDTRRLVELSDDELMQICLQNG
jgi:phage terminase small subunit